MKLLEIKDLNLNTTKKRLCCHLNFEIKTGELWGVLGPNGCGKTTLLLTLAGLLPAIGKIFLHEKELVHISRKTLARQVGILFQNTSDVFPQTVYEFCSSGRYPYHRYFGWKNDEDTHIVQQALHIMELDALHNQNIQTLSGGERRRLSIAALIAQSPTLYLLDEPTNHLDLRHQIQTLKYFRYLVNTQPISVCMSIHDINIAAQFCDKILLLTGNETFLLGNSQDILTEKNLTYVYQQPLVKREGIFPN